MWWHAIYRTVTNVLEESGAFNSRVKETKDKGSLFLKNGSSDLVDYTLSFPEDEPS
jgi:hypothetical protein